MRETWGNAPGSRRKKTPFCAVMIGHEVCARGKGKVKDLKRQKIKTAIRTGLIVLFAERTNRPTDPPLEKTRRKKESELKGADIFLWGKRRVTNLNPKPMAGVAATPEHRPSARRGGRQFPDFRHKRK